MTVVRPAIVGLLLGALVGFVGALLRPRSRSAYVVSPAPDEASIGPAAERTG